MPQDDSRTSGKLLTKNVSLWKSNEEGFVTGKEMYDEPHHVLALEYLAEKNFVDPKEFMHDRDCYYKTNHCHIENRHGTRFVRPSRCSKFMLNSGEALIQQQLQPGNPKQKWLPVYHGTHPKNVASILKHGLVPSGKRAGDKTVSTTHGSALGDGVYTTMMPLYAQIYAHPEKWRDKYHVQTFFMLCQSPDSLEKHGKHGSPTASIIGRTDVYKLYGGHIEEDESQFVTFDTDDFCICALMVKIHEEDPCAKGGEFYEVVEVLKEIDAEAERQKKQQPHGTRPW